MKFSETEETIIQHIKTNEGSNPDGLPTAEWFSASTLSQERLGLFFHVSPMTISSLLRKLGVRRDLKPKRDPLATIARHKFVGSEIFAGREKLRSKLIKTARGVDGEILGEFAKMGLEVVFGIKFT